MSRASDHSRAETIANRREDPLDELQEAQTELCAVLQHDLIGISRATLFQCWPLTSPQMSYVSHPLALLSSV